MKEISMFTSDESVKFAVIFSDSKITVETFGTFDAAKKKAAWMSSYHSIPFEVAKVVASTHAEHA